MKKTLFILASLFIILGSLLAVDSASADNILWKVSSSSVQPVNSGWNVSSTQFCLNGTCIAVWPAGGGGSSSTNLYGLFPIVVNQSGTNATASCPTCIATNTGDWAGTWNHTHPTDYYASSNPNNFISSAPATTTITASGTTLTGPTFTLGTSTTIIPYASGTAFYWKFASLNNSQFTNDSNYFTSVIFNLVATTSDYSASVSGNTITLNYLTSSTWMKPGNNLSELTNTSTARTNLGLGSSATHPSTDYLASSTAFVSTFNGGSGAQTGVGSIATSGPVNANVATGSVSLSLNLGAYEALSGNNLTVSSTLASTSVSFNWIASTSQPLYVGLDAAHVMSATTTVTQIICWDKTASATTTHEIYYTTSTVSDATSTGHIILASFPCGTAGNTTTTFSSTTIPGGAVLWDQIIGQAGSNLFDVIHVIGTKQ